MFVERDRTAAISLGRCRRYGDCRGRHAKPARVIAAAGLACMNSAAWGASENAVRVEAARYAATNRSCCRIRAVAPPRAANDRAPGNLDSDIAPSIRANTASFSSLKSEPNPLAQNPNPPMRVEPAGKMAGLCGKGPCVSRKIHTISSGTVASMEKKQGNTFCERRLRSDSLPETLSAQFALLVGFFWSELEPALPWSEARMSRACCSCCFLFATSACSASSAVFPALSSW